jgi:hypothetical protein
VQEFFDNFTLALEEVKITSKSRMVKDILEAWGPKYIEDQLDNVSIRSLATHLKDYVGKSLDSIVNKNKDFLVAWNEHWAEGFTNVLLKHNDRGWMDNPDEDAVFTYHAAPVVTEVPHVIEDLIHRLLRL